MYNDASTIIRRKLNLNSILDGPKGNNENLIYANFGKVLRASQKSTNSVIIVAIVSQV